MYKVRYIFVFIILLFYRERIIEYTLPSTDGPLIKSTVKEFVASVAARTSAPGGGSVSALVAAMVLIFLNNYTYLYLQGPRNWGSRSSPGYP